MWRKAWCVAVIGLTLCSVPLAGNENNDGTHASGKSDRRTSAPPARRASSTKRVIWTLVGIGAGFGAGAFLGFNAFDDAINSDRKVWTSALVGAAAGGVAANLLTRNVGRRPQVHAATMPASALDISVTWPAFGVRTGDDDILRQRVRRVAIEP